MGLRLVWLAVLVAVAIVSGATTYGALAARIPERPATLFVLRPTTGESQPVLQGEIVSAVVSRDGSTFAIGRNDQDPSLTGLWVGSLGDRPPSPHRLIADDPLFAGSPPV